MSHSHLEAENNTEKIVLAMLEQQKKSNALIESLIKEIDNLKHSISSDLSDVENAIDRIQGQVFLTWPSWLPPMKAANNIIQLFN